MLTLCVPVLKRYDLLMQMLDSAFTGKRKPDRVVIVNNGYKSNWDLAAELPELCECFSIHKGPTGSMGLAESWNFMVSDSKETRVIVNDDIIFAPHSLREIVACEGDFVSALAGSNAFSCFKLSDACIAKVGLFDESISPGYAYWEDCDYSVRMEDAGVPLTAIDCGVQHVGSQTVGSYTTQEMDEHHRKFQIAQQNYIKKHGMRLPGGRRLGE